MSKCSVHGVEYITQETKGWPGRETKCLRCPNPFHTAIELSSEQGLLSPVKLSDICTYALEVMYPSELETNSLGGLSLVCDTGKARVTKAEFSLDRKHGVGCVYVDFKKEDNAPLCALLAPEVLLGFEAILGYKVHRVFVLNSLVIQYYANCAISLAG